MWVRKRLCYVQDPLWGGKGKAGVWPLKSECIIHILRGSYIDTNKEYCRWLDRDGG